MNRCISFIVLYGLVNLCHAEDGLPQPHYHRQAADPAWLATVVQFHGHLGPSVVAGARMGMIGLRAVEAKGYFDVEVTCEGPLAKPPQSCFLDGVQVATGATLGKRTLQWVQADRLTVRIKNTGRARSPYSDRPPRCWNFSPRSSPSPRSEPVMGMRRRAVGGDCQEGRGHAGKGDRGGSLPRPRCREARRGPEASPCHRECSLALVDDGKYGEGWDVAAEYLKTAVTKDDFEKSVKTARKPLGKMKSREVKSKEYRKSLPGAPDGEYIVIQFKSL